MFWSVQVFRNADLSEKRIGQNKMTQHHWCPAYKRSNITMTTDHYLTACISSISVPILNMNLSGFITSTKVLMTTKFIWKDVTFRTMHLYLTNHIQRTEDICHTWPLLSKLTTLQFIYNTLRQKFWTNLFPALASLNNVWNHHPSGMCWKAEETRISYPGWQPAL